MVFRAFDIARVQPLHAIVEVIFSRVEFQIEGRRAPLAHLGVRAGFIGDVWRGAFGHIEKALQRFRQHLDCEKRETASSYVFSCMEDALGGSDAEDTALVVVCPLGAILVVVTLLLAVSILPRVPVTVVFLVISAPVAGEAPASLTATRYVDL